VTVLAVYNGGTWIKFFVSENATREQTDAVVEFLPIAEGFFEAPVHEVRNIPITVERTRNTVKISTEGTLIELEQIRNAAGEPIRISGLPAHGFPGLPYLDHTQYKTVALTRSCVESYGEKSIAVLPFVNMSPDPDQAYFADGIAEELLNLLATIPTLRVTSRSSSFMFRGDALDLPEVAAKLNVAHILEGSVRKAGNQVRITVQLIEAKSDTHLWSETYDRPLDDIFAIQDEVAGQVVEQLRLALLGETPKAQLANLEAYALFLEARQIVALQHMDEYSKAEELLKEALQRPTSRLGDTKKRYTSTRWLRA
jgi:TolB-like protein